LNKNNHANRRILLPTHSLRVLVKEEEVRQFRKTKPSYDFC